MLSKEKHIAHIDFQIYTLSFESLVEHFTRLLDIDIKFLNILFTKTQI